MVDKKKKVLYLSGDSAGKYFGIPIALKEYYSDKIVDIDSYKPVSYQHIVGGLEEVKLACDYNMFHLGLILKNNDYDLIIATSLSSFYLLECLEKQFVDTGKKFAGKIILNVPFCEYNSKIEFIVKGFEKYSSKVFGILEAENDEYSNRGLIKDIISSDNYDFVDLEHNETDKLFEYIIKRGWLEN